MAWSFRKRIKVAPGVHLNVSKSGVSTTVGRRGVSLTMGPKGTYVNTSIPGTGIYSRKKISDGPLSSSGPSYPATPSGSSSSSERNGPNNYGCISIFLMMILLIAGYFIYTTATSLSWSKEQMDSKTTAIRDSVETIVSPSDSLYRETLSTAITSNTDVKSLREEIEGASIALGVAIVVAFACIVVLILMAVKSKNSRNKDEYVDKGPTLQTPTKPEFVQVTSTPSSAPISNTHLVSNDPIKQAIIDNSEAHQLVDEANNSLLPSIEEFEKELLTNPSFELQSKLSEIRAKYERIIAGASFKFYDPDRNLSENSVRRIEDYSKLFQALNECQYKAILLSSRIIPIDDNPVHIDVVKHPVEFKTGYFDTLKSKFTIPVLPLADGKMLYFYPRFIIKAGDISEFEVIPTKDVHIRCRMGRFLEKGFVPAEAQILGTTSLYGSLFQVVRYDELTIMPFNVTYIISGSIENIIDTVAPSLVGKSKNKQSTVVKMPSKEDKYVIDDVVPVDELEEPVTGEAYYDEPYGKYDSRIREAAALLAQKHLINSSVLQRGLNMGYARSCRVIDQIRETGIYGDGFGPLKIYDLLSRPQEALALLDAEVVAIESLGVSRQYYNDVKNVVQHLLDLCDHLAYSSDIETVIQDKVPSAISWQEKTITKPYEKIALLMIADLMACYEGLDHPLDFDNAEGIGLKLFCVLLSTLDPKGTVGKGVESHEAFKKEFGPALTSLRESVIIYGHPFILEECLREYEQQAHDKYIVLLFRFASLVAKADNKVVEEEAAWLQKVMQLIIAKRSVKTDKPSVVVTKTRAHKVHSDAARELDELIGLTPVKEQINTLTNFIKVQQLRKERGLRETPVSYHCVFTGNPGTGKTTVARIVSEIYRELGILEKGHLVETDRSGLVAEYVGQTAVKTNSIIDSALDGVLFIDEAYSLVDGGNSDYGKEAISTLLKRMEDDRNRLVVILAGYTEDMKRFIDSNPGLQSRFNRYIEFPDYTAEELYQIFITMVEKNDYSLTEEAKALAKSYFEKKSDNRDKNFGNGRFVRNIFEKVLENLANRVTLQPRVTEAMLTTIEAEDIQHAI